MLEIDRIESSEDFRETIKLATNFELSFYDASYLYKARSRDLALVTGDKRLEKKAKQAGAKIRPLDEFLVNNFQA
jgi:predicted nucleic acid-binding protein